MLYLLLCAAASVLRMLAAYVLSVLLALVFGVAMARSRSVERFLLPILDILQSIPILGFFPAALAFFVTVLPAGIGVEAAAVFLIITSQLWNLIFGVYSSVKSLDPMLFDMSKVYRMGRATVFFYLCVPASRNSLVANSLISWAGGWFFLTSSEIITMGAAEHRLLGLGTFIMEAFERGDSYGFYLGVASLLTVILATYILVWNPAGETILERELISLRPVYSTIESSVGSLWSTLGNLMIKAEARIRLPSFAGKAIVIAVLTSIAYFLVGGLKQLPSFDIESVYGSLLEVAYELPLSLARVSTIVAFSVFLSLAATYASYARKGIMLVVLLVGEVLASIPAVVWWPLLASIALGSPLGPYMVATVVMLQGSLWYLYFNLIVYGLAGLRKDLEEMSKVYRIRGLWYLRSVFIPSLLPSLASGALSAWGGAWNSTVAAEYVSFGERVIDIGGVGAVLNRKAAKGDALGVAMSALLLSLVITVFNKALWKRFFEFIERRYGGGE